jgi:uncharacterized protein involved in response to NO
LRNDFPIFAKHVAGTTSMNSRFNIEDPDTQPVPRFALFALGFRPFFLLAGIAAVLLVPLWVQSFVGAGPVFTYYDPLTWHGHEMLFGYSVAVIAGFLLTAVQNWTGLPTTSGKALAGLALLWLAGRIAPFFADALPGWLIASVDLLFLPVLAIAIALPLLRSRQNQQLVFLLVLAALTAANLMVHLQLLGFDQSSTGPGLKLATYLVILLVTILGGRVIPFFTNRGLNREASCSWKAIEILAIASLLLLLILDMLAAAPTAIATLAGLAALMHAIRLYGWYQAGIWRVPLLWVLHLAYAWLVVGLLLQALGVSGQINPSLYLHAFSRCYWRHDAWHDGACFARTHESRAGGRLAARSRFRIDQPGGVDARHPAAARCPTLQPVDPARRRFLDPGICAIRARLRAHPHPAAGGRTPRLARQSDQGFVASDFAINAGKFRRRIFPEGPFGKSSKK